MCQFCTSKSINNDKFKMGLYLGIGKRGACQGWRWMKDTASRRLHLRKMGLRKIFQAQTRTVQQCYLSVVKYCMYVSLILIYYVSLPESPNIQCSFYSNHNQYQRNLTLVGAQFGVYCIIDVNQIRCFEERESNLLHSLYETRALVARASMRF